MMCSIRLPIEITLILESSDLLISVKLLAPSKHLVPPKSVEKRLRESVSPNPKKALAPGSLEARLAPVAL